MRFLLKIGFWVALVAFFLPSNAVDDSPDRGVNYLGAFAGAQQALSDMGGFCERSPAACAAGHDVGSYVAARVKDGLAYGYAAMHGQVAPQQEPANQPSVATPAALRTPAAPSRPQAPAPASTRSPAPVASPERAQAPDPMQTAALTAERVRRAAGLEPFSMPSMEKRVDRSTKLEPSRFVHAGASRSVPTPTPRP